MLSRLARRLVILFRGGRFHKDLEEEMRLHRELREQEKVAEGLSPKDAHYAVSRQFGNELSLRERSRAMWGWKWLDNLLQDVRYGLRQLRRNPGFTIVAVLTLALGIGANTAIFSIVDAVMLRTLPVRNAGHLVLLDWYAPQWPAGLIQSGYGNEFSYPIFEQFAAQRNVFSSLFGFAQCGALRVVINNQASLAQAEMVTGTYFSALGVKPILGRPITDQDEEPGAPHVAVISYRYWTRALGQDRSALGRTINLNGVPFMLVGVAPPEFSGVEPGYDPDLWLPVAEPAAISPWGGRPGNRSPRLAGNWWWIDVMGGLMRGVSATQARARLDPLIQQDVVASLGKGLTGPEIPRLVIRPASHGLSQLPQRFGQPLLLLMAAVGLLLLIACANVAGLLLARATTRQREIATRLALGATRARLVVQLLVESLTLSGIGAAAGGFIAYWATRALLSLTSNGSGALVLNVRPDTNILVFAVMATVLTGLLFGIAPAFFAARTKLTPMLKTAPGATLSGAQRSQMGVGKGLVTAQVGVCMVLLIGSGLLVRTLQNLRGQNLGFNQKKLLLFSIDPTPDGYQGTRLVDFYTGLLQRIRSLPGVKSATLSSLTLIGGIYNGAHIAIEDYTPKAGQDMHVYWNAVGPDFFQTMGIPVLLGRGITEDDAETSPRVAVINQAMSREYFGHESPVGRRFRIPGAPTPSVEYEIVGVVGNTKYSTLRGEFPPTAYFSYNQLRWALGATHYEVHTAGDPVMLVPTVQHLIHGMDPDLPLSDVKTEVEQINESLGQERLLSNVLSSFGTLALLMACVGLYGLMAYAVVRRTNEIGIRMALGAQRSDVLWMVGVQGLKLVVIGVVIGVVGALMLMRFLSSLLYGVKPTDPLTFIAVSLILIAVALLASYVPARRATKVDPMVALRYE